MTREMSDSRTIRALSIFVGFACFLLLCVVIYSIAAVNDRLSHNHDQATIARQQTLDELTHDTTFREKMDQERQRELLQRLDQIDRDTKKGS